MSHKILKLGLLILILCFIWNISVYAKENVFTTKTQTIVNTSKNVEKLMIKIPLIGDKIKEKKEEEKIEYNNGICKADGEVNIEYCLKVNRELAKIDKKLLNKFKKSKWKIYVTSKNLNQIYYNNKYTSVLGSTNKKEKTIWIENNLDAVNNAPIHEFGHWIDMNNDWLSKKNSFKKIDKEERKKLIKTFDITTLSNQQETFADAFMWYVKDSEKLKKKCSKIYLYINQLTIENF